MHRSVGLLIDSADQIDQVAHKVAAATSATVAPTPDPTVWQVAFADFEATLTTNRPDIAGEALARRYRFAIAARMAEGRTQATSAEVRTLREAGRVLREAVDLPSLLVVDGQNRRPDRDHATEGEPPGSAPVGA